MPIVTNPHFFFCEHHFVFLENDLLLRKEGLHRPLGSADLPGEDTLKNCLGNHAASDWFTETELNYTALMLEKDCPLPAGCRAIPLRQFFWEAKTEQEQEQGLPSALGGLAARAHGFLRLRQDYRYCPACGAPLRDDPDLAARRCIRCQRQLFPRIEPAVIVLVSRGDEVLLAKSKTVRSSPFYSCIAGFVEHGESVEQCVAREVMEETGIAVRNIRYVGSQAWPFPDQLMLAFTADYASGDIRIQEREIEDARWFPRSALPEIPKPGSVAYNLITGRFRHGAA